MTQEEEERLCLDEYCRCPSSLKRACPLREEAARELSRELGGISHQPKMWRAGIVLTAEPGEAE